MDVFASNERPSYTIHPVLGTLEEKGGIYTAANGNQYKRDANGRFTQVIAAPEGEAELKNGWYDEALVI